MIPQFFFYCIQFAYDSDFFLLIRSVRIRVNQEIDMDTCVCVCARCLFFMVRTTKHNKFLRLRQSQRCWFLRYWIFCMNVTIKWAIQIYRIIHKKKFLLSASSLPFILCFARFFSPHSIQPDLKTQPSLFHILWFYLFERF